MRVYDLIIIGAGPAGITASVYAARKKMDFIVITGNVGGQTLWTKDIENYTSYQFITGSDLVQKFREHLERFKAQVKEGEYARQVKRNKGVFDVETDKGTYRSKTIIIASGRVPRKLGVEGEDVFQNKGVAYCATCDGPLFAGMDVAVIGGGNAGLDAVIQMIKIASKVYLVDINPEFHADPIMADKVKQSDKVVIYSNAEVKQVYGDEFVRGIKLSVSGETKHLDVRGVFVEIGSLPDSDFVADAAKNEAGEIFINCRSETSIPGMFAAGDVTDVPAKQIIVASGEGAKALLSAFTYLSKMK